MPKEPSSEIRLIEIKAEVPKDKCKMMSIIAQYKVEELKQRVTIKWEELSYFMSTSQNTMHPLEQ